MPSPLRSAWVLTAPGARMPLARVWKACAAGPVALVARHLLAGRVQHGQVRHAARPEGRGDDGGGPATRGQARRALRVEQAALAVAQEDQGAVQAGVEDDQVVRGPGVETAD